MNLKLEDIKVGDVLINKGSWDQKVLFVGRTLVFCEVLKGEFEGENSTISYRHLKDYTKAPRTEIIERECWVSFNKDVGLSVFADKSSADFWANAKERIHCEHIKIKLEHNLDTGEYRRVE